MLAKGTSMSEAEVLAAAYTMPDTGLVNYKKLDEDMKSMRKRTNGSTVPLGIHNPFLSSSEKACIKEILVKARGGGEESAALMLVFEKFDFHKYGAIQRKEVNVWERGGRTEA